MHNILTQSPIGKRKGHVKKLLTLLLLCAVPLLAQTSDGELRIAVTDPSGLGVKTTVAIVSDANQYRNTLTTDERGAVTAQHLPYGLYRVEIHPQGFSAISRTVEIRSAIPTDFPVRLQVTAVNESLTVSATSTLIDPDQAGSVSQIGAAQIQDRAGSLPGRSLQDLVSTQPGWIYEGNAVLHPRGSEYQTQFVVDGVPLTDNRSPSFGPEIEAADVQSLSIYTAGFPAEYGRKMGGVVEVNTEQDSQPGLHGQLVLSGGSFDTAGGFTREQYTWGANTLSASAGGDFTGHYLNPVVPQNYTNRGSTGDFSLRYARDFTPRDKFTLTLRHEVARYELPNEQVQQAPHQNFLDPSQPLGSQLENGNNFETMGIASYQHAFSPRTLADFYAMARNNENGIYSNAYSDPVMVFQRNRFNEEYLKASVTLNRGRHEWKAGVESDNIFLHENFSYLITDPTQFDDDTPPTFAFAGSRPDLEQAAFVQDLIHLGNWTINAGLRWDHYQLVVNRQALDPRLAVSRYIPSAGMVLHFSYDRVFQTPSFENILLSSSPAILSLDPANFLRLPVEPSEGNYYEAGVAKTLFKNFKLDVNYFRRLVNNYADDDQIQNTTISFPIAFQKAVIYGAEAKLNLPRWGRFSGTVSYSYTVGNAWFPVTGGLFLGDDAANAETQLTGHFPDSQDQRNTLRSRLRYQVSPRFWVAGGINYDSGLPFEFDGDPDTVLAQYGPQVLDRINFSRGRIDPSLILNVSAGADVYTSDRLKMQLQVDGENLTNVLDVIDFGGLFSGNAIGPPRSFALRLTSNF